MEDGEYEPTATVRTDIKQDDQIDDKEDTDELLIPTNQIILGDCVEGMKKLPSGCASLVLTDPPYGVGYQSRLRQDTFDLIEGDGKNDPVLSWSIAQCYRVLKENSHCYVFTCWQTLPRFLYLMGYWHFNVKNTIIGKRAGHSCGSLNYGFAPSYEMIVFAHKGKREFSETTIRRLSDDTGYVKRFDDMIDWLPVNEPSKSIEFHPTQKSLELIEFFMLVSSNKGNLVIDPFSGSGITAVAAWDLGRDFICYEINEDYYNKSIKYLNEFKAGKHNDILNRVHKKLGCGIGRVRQVNLFD